uniref:Uncharacterized protein n=1 Tax=Picea glauca TaxID=3330 RepID=A0A101LU94_PICGL|nr:hypothetical protein ABT39_MTgene3389 [Picea glauca]KUM45462.1 hypothetical protein ABT39_MTgene2564 [Picea glauca]KUM45471.1 hypothetical protein ABT39_MTgene2573 [Picea glauca]QHR89002.1 hypothetical protein Q903MT_gene3021 [Picea sitchensis]
MGLKGACWFPRALPLGAYFIPFESRLSTLPHLKLHLRISASEQCRRIVLAANQSGGRQGI